MIKVSIIVPVYKAEPFLDRCVSSLVSQTLKDIEIILVDDGSPDRSGAMCDEWQQKDTRIKVIHKQNEGAGFARNSGMKLAEGEYIGFIDSDDYAEKEMFEHLYHAAAINQAQFAMTGYYVFGGTVFHKEDNLQTFNLFDQDRVFNSEDEINQLMLDIGGALPQSANDSKYGLGVVKCIFQRSVIQDHDIQFRSEREIVSEDTLFQLDFLAVTSKAVGVSGAYYYYCWNGDSISKSYNKDRMNKSMLLYHAINDSMAKRMPKEKYQLYTDRTAQAYARCACIQAIQSAAANPENKKGLNQYLKTICRSSDLQQILRHYPWWRLPVKQAVFAFAMKHSLFLLQRVLVALRKEM